MLKKGKLYRVTSSKPFTLFQTNHGFMDVNFDYEESQKKEKNETKVTVTTGALVVYVGKCLFTLNHLLISGDFAGWTDFVHSYYRESEWLEEVKSDEEG